ncbi:hypothetical protein ACFL1R_06060 [Candidatus Latescibacterota bacterium]
MRKFAFILISLTFLSTEVLAEMSVNIQNNFGYTIVNVSEAMEIPEYSNITDEGLVDWNQFNYKGLIQILFKKSENVSFGPEIGFNRLYYWEEKHIPPGFSPRWRWGTIWTGHVGGVVRRSFASHYYVLTGASLHVFFNGSGATIGIPLAIGHELPISKVFTIPIEFRLDVVFGDAVPIGIGGGVGIKYRFGE